MRISQIIILAFIFVAIVGSVFGVTYFYFASSKIIHPNTIEKHFSPTLRGGSSDENQPAGQ